ncbi:MAG: hypothetical protein P1V51_11780 [Deltaproteobacteria bacterium]|nr:hypothetical protein [Deltaproteobacteria bacterium]
MTPKIGTLNEGALHAALKDHYARPGDEFEVPLEGFVIDIRRPGQLVEIQTGSFGAMGRKFDRLLEEHRILLVHPIALRTYLRRPGQRERRSPKRGSLYDLFEELVSIPTLLDHPNLSLDVVLVSVTQVQVPDARARRGRGGFRTVDRELREILETHHFGGAGDLAALLPADLPREFTTSSLAARLGAPRAVAQRMVYCLRALEVITEVGRDRSGSRYRRSPGF